MDKTNKTGSGHDHAPEPPKLTVVLLHGIAADPTTFDALLAHLKSEKSLKNVRFVAPSLLGSGRDDGSSRYDFDAQIDALRASLQELDTPVVVVGHSMGALIATRYAAMYPKAVLGLILISLPLFTQAELENPAFGEAMEQFVAKIGANAPELVSHPAFRKAIDSIVMAPDNYETALAAAAPKTIIYGERDTLVLPANYKKLQNESEAKVELVKTSGRHGVTPDKFPAIQQALERILDEAI